MTQHVLLNNVAHKDLRVLSRYSADLGHNVGSVLTFPTEFGDIQREYPIFFRKDPQTGEFSSVALLGFAQNENLFLDGNGGWTGSYVPGIVARGPFLIGFQEQVVEGQTQRNPVVHVDLDDARISKSEGEPIFLPQGGNSPYLERVAAILNGLHAGMAMSQAMFAVFNELELIEPVKLQIKLDDEQFDLIGMHTLNEEKLAALEGEPLTKLHKSGFLHGAYLVLASISNVNRLLAKKQARRAAAGTPIS